MGMNSDLERVSMIVLRSMRPPVFVLLFVYAVGITGMALIPSYDLDGNPETMSLFHAFYFITYTATTTGFGEIPNEFSDAQRLWAIACLYVGVIAWLYAIGSVIRLLQNQHFVLALNEYRFAGMVRRLQEPFYIVCGFGDTGSLLVRGLDDNYLRAVVIDNDSERIKALKLRDYHNEVPGLCADVGVPKHLVDAGILQPHCVAVVILTEHEPTNLKVAVMARFLNSDLKVLCRTTSVRVQQHLSRLDSVTVINPFEIFAERLSAAIVAPQLIHLSHWLAGASRSSLDQVSRIPTGRWIVCGYGRMGKWLHRALDVLGIEMTIVDPEAQDADGVIITKDYADYHVLEQAGIEDAVCIVAGTPIDSENLSILLSAQTLNPKIHTIVRQNYHENQLVFDAGAADLIMQSSLITARTVLTHCISPHIARLEAHLRTEGEQATSDLVSRIERVLCGRQPQLFRVRVEVEFAEALADVIQTGHKVLLYDIQRDPHCRDQNLGCVPLMIQRGTTRELLPNGSYVLQIGDDILFCGTKDCEAALMANLNNPYSLHYCLHGTDRATGYVFSWLSRRFA